MARFGVVCLFWITLGLQVAVVSAMPARPSQDAGPMHTRLQCPQCSKSFASVSSLHKHRGKLLGRTACGSDMSQPLYSAWSGRGPRPAGTAHDLSRGQARLMGLTDSDSDRSSLDGDRGPASNGEGGAPDSPAHIAGEPACPPAVAPMPQVKIITYKHIHSHKVWIYTHTFIHTYTYT